MSVAFWSAKLSNDGKGVEVQPPENFVLIVTNAALDLESSNKGSVAVKLTTESIEGEKISSILGTLNPEKFPQFSLNVCLGYDVETTFSVVGPKDSKATVHLSGYYQPAPDNDGDGMDEFDEEDFDEEDDEDDEEDDESEEEEAPVAVKPAVTNGKKVETKKVEVKKNGAKAAPLKVTDADSDDEEVNAKTIAKMVKEAQAAAMEEDDESEEDDEDDDEDEEDDSEDEESEDDSEDMPPLKVQKTQPQGFSTKPNNNNKTPSKPINNAPKTPQTGNNKPAPQSGNKNNNSNSKTPNAQQNKTPNAQQNKTPQTGNKNHNSNNNSGFKSGDKRKR